MKARTRGQDARRLPHERDEAPDAGAVTQEVIAQAERDVSAGLVDTDDYNRARDVTAPALARRRRRART